MTFHIHTSSAGRHVWGFSGGNEQRDYGHETVANIKSNSSVNLNATTVRNSVQAGGSIHANGANVTGLMNAGGSIHATDTNAHAINAGGSASLVNCNIVQVNAGGSTTATRCPSLGDISAGGNITANQCQSVGNVHAGGSASLVECPNILSVAGDRLTLHSSTVQGDVISGTDVSIKNVNIHGTLTCSSNHQIIEGSTIDTIVLRRPNIMPFGARGHSMVFGGGVSMVQIGNETFINGIPISQLHARSARENAVQEQPKQILELRNCTVRNVIFEGGNGELITLESVVTGDVTGRAPRQA